MLGQIVQNNVQHITHHSLAYIEREAESDLLFHEERTGSKIRYLTGFENSDAEQILLKDNFNDRINSSDYLNKDKANVTDVQFHTDTEIIADNVAHLTILDEQANLFNTQQDETNKTKYNDKRRTEKENKLATRQMTNVRLNPFDNLMGGSIVSDSYEYRKNIYATYFQPNRKQHLVNCSAIVLDENEQEVAKARQVMQKRPQMKHFIQKYIRTLDCYQYKLGRGYIQHPLSSKEYNFPLAFSILAYRDLEQTERLFRAIYRPHNFYCVHIDIKTDLMETRAFQTIAKCFDNVIIIDRPINVTWGTFSVLEAELLCMEKLWQFKTWKYFINLTGQEFPLKTNREIVAILESLDGANIVDGTWIR